MRFQLHLPALAQALVLGGLAHFAGTAGAQDLGTRLSDVELTGLEKTGATSYDDFLGRTVLIEFFAHW